MSLNSLELDLNLLSLVFYESKHIFVFTNNQCAISEEKRPYLAMFLFRFETQKINSDNSMLLEFTRIGKAACLDRMKRYGGSWYMRSNVRAQYLINYTKKDCCLFMRD